MNLKEKNVSIIVPGKLDFVEGKDYSILLAPSQTSCAIGDAAVSFVTIWERELARMAELDRLWHIISPGDFNAIPDKKKIKVMCQNGKRTEDSFGYYEKTAYAWAKGEWSIVAYELEEEFNLLKRAKEDGFIPWLGKKECPVIAMAPVLVRYRGGDTSCFYQLAKRLWWDHKGGVGDIFGYKAYDQS